MLDILMTSDIPARRIKETKRTLHTAMNL